MVILNQKMNILMTKYIKEKNMILNIIYFLKVNIYMVKKEKEKNILMEDQNMMENIYLIENIMEKDIMKMEI